MWLLREMGPASAGALVLVPRICEKGVYPLIIARVFRMRGIVEAELFNIKRANSEKLFRVRVKAKFPDAKFQSIVYESICSVAYGRWRSPSLSRRLACAC